MRSPYRDTPAVAAGDGGGATGGSRRTLGTLRLLRNAACRLVAAALVASVASALPAGHAGASTTGSATQRVIVSSSSLTTDVVALVESVGGVVDGHFSSVNGVVADVTQTQSALLALTPGVTVSPDSGVMVTGTPAPRPPAAVFPQSTGATKVEASGVNGSRIGVAVLDTGIDSLPDFSGRLVAGVDLSGEGNPFRDSFGHGTFVAGLIAGNGASSGGAYTGEAPGADLISVKVAGASGATDMATVISGIDWVLANQGSLNIKVLNISLGTVPTQSTVINPLDHAVETAWDSGITVVVSAGNAGPFNGTIMTPGDDPLVITVGALDDNGTASPTDDQMTAFSSVGPTAQDGWYKPDLVASGRSVVSLRAQGSTIDTNYPSARVGAANFVGSGSSFSAAITSGAVALIDQYGGSDHPDDVKARLLASATPGPVGDPFVDGHGALNAYGAAQARAELTQQLPVTAGLLGNISLSSTWAASSWNNANWTNYVGGPTHTSSLLGGSLPGTGSAWNGSAWNGSAWNGSAWNSSGWNGSAWNGSAWNGSAWNGSAWN